MSKIVLITGGGGQLARCLQLQKSKNLLLLPSKKTLNVLDKRQLNSYVVQHKPDLIIHLASMTKGDLCAAKPEEAYEVNVNGTKNVVFECVKGDLPLMLVSSNEVFDGTKKSFYTETDVPNPKSVAGKTKYLAEEIVKTYMKKYYIIRTMWLYSEWSNNFIQAITKIAMEKGEVSLTSDEVGSPTSSHDLACAILKLIETDSYGIFNIVNKGAVSRLEFGARVLDRLKSRRIVKILPVSLSRYKRLSMPPKRSALSTKKIERIGIKMRPWTEALDKFLRKQKI